VHPGQCLDGGCQSVVAVRDVEGPVSHGVHQGVGVLADHCPDRLVDALTGGLQDRSAGAARGDDRVQGVVGPVGERDRAGRHPDLEQVAGQQVGPARPDRLVAQDPPVVGTGHGDEAQDSGLGVVADLHAVQEQGRSVVRQVGTGVVDALHGSRTSGDQAVDVIAPVGWHVLLGAGHVQEAVRVRIGHRCPLLRRVGVVGTGGDPIGPCRVDDQAGKCPQDIHC